MPVDQVGILENVISLAPSSSTESGFGGLGETQIGYLLAESNKCNHLCFRENGAESFFDT